LAIRERKELGLRVVIATIKTQLAPLVVSPAPDFGFADYTELYLSYLKS
jgi:hypothetical protein